MTWKCLSCGKLYAEQENTGGLSAGKAAIGAVVAGPAGAIVGAAMGKKTRNDCCPYCGSTLRKDAMLANAKAVVNLMSNSSRTTPAYEQESHSETEAAQKQQTPVQGPSGLYTAESATKRAFQFLEDGEFERANSYAEAALDVDPEYGDAYIVKLLCEFGISSIEDLGVHGTFTGRVDEIRNHKLYQRAIKYCDNMRVAQLENQLSLVQKRLSFCDAQVEKINQLIDSTPEGWSLFDVALWRSKVGNIENGIILTPHGELLDLSGKLLDIDSQGHYVAICHHGTSRSAHLLKDDGTASRISLNYSRCERAFRELDSPCTDWNNIVSIGRASGITIGITATGKIKQADDEDK